MGQFTSGKIVTVTLLAGIFGCLAIKTMDPKEIEISPGVSCCEQKVLKPKGQWTCLLEKETFTNYQDFTAQNGTDEISTNSGGWDHALFLTA